MYMWGKNISGLVLTFGFSWMGCVKNKTEKGEKKSSIFHSVELRGAAFSSSSSNRAAEFTLFHPKTILMFSANINYIDLLQSWEQKDYINNQL